jgi:hypothetical protein
VQEHPGNYRPGPEQQDPGASLALLKLRSDLERVYEQFELWDASRRDLECDGFL